MGKRQLNRFFYSGLSGLALPLPKYKFPAPYENSSRLEYYASFFNSIEINSSFYKLPRSVTIRNWVSSVPDNFRFTFKLWKQITHVKGLFFDPSDVREFLNAIASAAGKKGCLLIQFPPSAGIENSAQLVKLLSCIREFDQDHEWRVAIEFRNKTWYNDTIYKMADDFESTIVIQDIPKSATPMLDLESSFVYIRFHGPTGNYRDSYNEDILSEYAGYVSDWVQEGKDVYVYFNNTMGDAFQNLHTLKKMIALAN